MIYKQLTYKRGYTNILKYKKGQGYTQNSMFGLMLSFYGSCNDDWEYINPIPNVIGGPDSSIKALKDITIRTNVKMKIHKSKP